MDCRAEGAQGEAGRVAQRLEVIPLPAAQIPVTFLKDLIGPFGTALDPLQFGPGDESDKSVTDFSERYADQNEQDYEDFVTAIRAGRLAVLEGV